VDEFTVKFTMCVPDPAMPAKAAFSAFQIHPSEYLEATGGGGELVEKPIGTGPFMIESWNRGENVVLTRFEDYWGEKALAPSAIFRWTAEGPQKLIELQAGTVDGIDNVAPDDIETVQNDPTRSRRRDLLFLCRDEQHLPAFRQRAGTPGDRHGYRPPTHRRYVLPTWVERG
jgi:ABC-type transport system substrate-binding protein